MGSVTAEGFPTIPIIFLGGIREDRSPKLNSMGLAVTTMDESMKSVTTVEVIDKGIEFILNGEPLDGKRGSDIFGLIKAMLEKAGVQTGLKIVSDNYKIKSGSSDSGVAALVTAIDTLLGMDLPMEEKIAFGKMGSESVQRSLLGGLSETNVDDYPVVKGIEVATAEELRDVRIFSVPFEEKIDGGFANQGPEYAKRITADEIHAAIVKHPKYVDREKETPERVKKIHALVGDLPEMFKVVLEDVENAHGLLEDMGLTVRRGPMKKLWGDVKGLGVPAVPTAGGGNLVSILTLSEYAGVVGDFLAKNNYKFRKCRVAPGARVIA